MWNCVEPVVKSGIGNMIEEKDSELEEALNKKDDENPTIDISMSNGQIQTDASDIWEAATEIVKRLFFWQNKN